jgi:hypothetical protein
VFLKDGQVGSRKLPECVVLGNFALHPEQRNRCLMCDQLPFEVTLLEVLTLQLHQVPQAEPLLGTHLLRCLQAEGSGQFVQLLAGGSVILDHLLGEVMYFGRGCFFLGQRGRLYFEHVAECRGVHEQLVRRHFTLLASLLSGLSRLLLAWLLLGRFSRLLLRWLRGLLRGFSRLLLLLLSGWWLLLLLSGWRLLLGLLLCHRTECEQCQSEYD